MKKSNDKVTPDEVLFLYEQLRQTARAGLPLPDSLKRITQESKRPYFKNAMDEVKQRLEQGASLSDALAPHTKDFSAYSLALIKAGEETGSLAEVLALLLREGRRKAHFHGVLKTAMVYPLAVLCFALLIICFVISSLSTEIIDIYDDLGAELPGMTLWFTTSFAGMIYMMLIIVGGALIVIFVSKAGRRFWDGIVLTIPVLERYVRYRMSAVFFTATAELVTRGVELPRAVALASTALDNSVIAKHIGDISGALSAGDSLGIHLSKSKYFSDMCGWVVTMSEERGDLAEALDSLGEYFEDKVTITEARQVRVFEPVLIVLLGIVLGIMIISFYLPLFNIARVII